MTKEINKKPTIDVFTDEMLRKQGNSQQARKAILKWYS
jgi:hypothetical protein